MLSHISPSSMQGMDTIIVELCVFGSVELGQVVIDLLVGLIVLSFKEVLHGVEEAVVCWGEVWAVGWVG